MMEPNKTLSKIIFIGINPITIWIYTFFLSVIIWGPGIVALGLTFFTGIFSLISYTIFASIKRPKGKELRRIYMSITYVLIFVGWQSLQLYGARGEKLKTFLIEDTIENEFVLQKSDVYFGGGESEIWLKLLSNKNAITKLIALKRFELINDIRDWKPDYFPKWWPDTSNDYYYYEFNEKSSERLYRILVSKDYRTVYYYYLYY